LGTTQPSTQVTQSLKGYMQDLSPSAAVRVYNLASQRYNLAFKAFLY